MDLRPILVCVKIKEDLMQKFLSVSYCVHSIGALINFGGLKKGSSWIKALIWVGQLFLFFDLGRPKVNCKLG